MLYRTGTGLTLVRGPACRMPPDGKLKGHSIHDNDTAEKHMELWNHAIDRRSRAWHLLHTGGISAAVLLFN